MSAGMNAVESRPPSLLSRLSSRELRSRRPDLERREPMLWQMLAAGEFLDEALEAELGAAAGELACGPGCDACCRQAIPITLAEGLAIRAFLRLAGLPLPERTISGYLDDDDPGGASAEAERAGSATEAKRSQDSEAAEHGAARTLPELAPARDLRAAGSAARRFIMKGDEPGTCPGGACAEIKNINRCPFLQNGCCTIYPARPFACRRFLIFRAPCACGEDPTVTRPDDVFRPSPKKLFEALCLTLPVYERLAVPVPAKVTRQFFNNHTHVIQAFPWRVTRR